jgi:hypothetical protein
MTVQDLVVIAGAIALSGALAWFFFGPRRARAAERSATRSRSR